MIIGLGTGEGGPGAGAASASNTNPPVMAAIRTRAQLDKLVMLKARVDSEKKEEERDESLLDDDSETEDRGINAVSATDAESASAMETESASGSVFRDEDGNTESDLESGFSPASTCVELDIGKGHATVTAARRAASCRRQLNPSPTTTEKAGIRTTFTSGGDERVLRCNIVHNIKDRTTSSASFDIGKKTCNTCVSGPHSAVAGRDGRPVVFAAADQSFPACVPATDAGECIRVVRVEDGSLQEIIHALADAIGNSKLDPGTVVALGSISHLAEVGSAQYLTDWVRSRHWLKSRFGETLIVCPLIPVLCGGWEGRSTVRALLEVLHWFLSVSDTEAVLMRGLMQEFINSNLAHKTGRGWADGRQCIKAPAGFDTKAFVSLVSEGWGCRPDGIPPMSPAAESVYLLSLLALLNDAFGTGLSLAPMLGRKKSDWKSTAATAAKKRFIAVIGGSNADRLAERLEEDERQVFRLTSPGWRVTRNSVLSVVTTIASLDPQPDSLIIQALDNSAFFCLQEDGTMSLPVRSYMDGKYHVEGELRVASVEQTNGLLRNLLPLLKAVPGAEVFIVTCLPRYVRSPCCEEATHLVGRALSGFKEKIIADLTSMKRAVRQFMHRERLVQVRVVDPTSLCEDLDYDQDNLDLDPVHQPPAFYAKLAAALTAMQEGEGFSSAEGRSDRRSGPDPKRIKLVSSSSGRGFPLRGGRGGGGGSGRAGRGGPRGGPRGRGFRGRF